MGYETELKLFIDGAWRAGEPDEDGVAEPGVGVHDVDVVPLGRPRAVMVGAARRTGIALIVVGSLLVALAG